MKPCIKVLVGALYYATVLYQTTNMYDSEETKEKLMKKIYGRILSISSFAIFCFDCRGVTPILYVQKTILNLPHPYLKSITVVLDTIVD